MRTNRTPKNKDKKITMEDLKKNRYEIISFICKECDESNLKVVMNKMVELVNENRSYTTHVVFLAHKAIEELEEEGVQVRDEGKMKDLCEEVRINELRKQKIALY